MAVVLGPVAPCLPELVHLDLVVRAGHAQLADEGPHRRGEILQRRKRELGGCWPREPPALDQARKSVEAPVEDARQLAVQIRLKRAVLAPEPALLQQASDEPAGD